MRGGDTATYKVSKDPEDSSEGTVAFHNYYIASDRDGGAKNIGVAMRTSVIYTAYKNGSPCSSDWVVNGVTNSGTSRIVFNRNLWDATTWFIPSMDTPIPNLYLISAHDVSHAVLKDSGEMAIFTADFKENAAHQYGFDDYTNWNAPNGNKGMDYYGAKAGRCVWPYASIREGTNGLCNLDILSFGHSRMFDIVSDSDSLNNAPIATTGSTSVQFDAATAWYNIFGEAFLSAKYDGAELAKLYVVPFKLQTRVILFVYVNNACTFSSSVSVLNGLYRQCVTEFSVLSVENFVYATPPSGNIWTSRDRNALKNALLADIGMESLVADSDHVVFIISGVDAIRLSIQAWADISGKYCWVYDTVASPNALPHEIGHNFGLDEEYDLSSVSGAPSTPGEDKDNVMNMVGSGANDRFRYGQWKIINRNH